MYTFFQFEMINISHKVLIIMYRFTCQPCRPWLPVEHVDLLTLSTLATMSNTCEYFTQIYEQILRKQIT